METADMVKVAVSAAPYSIDKPYSYLVPEALSKTAVPGVRVATARKGSVTVTRVEIARHRRLRCAVDLICHLCVPHFPAPFPAFVWF